MRQQLTMLEGELRFHKKQSRASLLPETLGRLRTEPRSLHSSLMCADNGATRCQFLPCGVRDRPAYRSPPDSISAGQASAREAVSCQVVSPNFTFFLSFTHTQMTQVAAPGSFIHLHSHNYSNDLRLSLWPPKGCLPADLCMSPVGSGLAGLPFSLPPVLMGDEWEEQATSAASLKMGDPMSG